MCCQIIKIIIGIICLQKFHHFFIGDKGKVLEVNWGCSSAATANEEPINENTRHKEISVAILKFFICFFSFVINLGKR